MTTTQAHPEPGQIWRHRNNNRYVVVCLANTSIPETPKHPYMVIYKNIDTNTLWARPLYDWHRSFTYEQNGCNPVIRG